MSWLLSLIRPDLRELEGYSSARNEAGSFVPDIAIDANEFPWLPFGLISNHCAANRYPEPQPKKLAQRLADIYGVSPAQLVMARGSDDGIDALIRLFCQAGVDEILTCPPTYGAYKVYAALQGAKVVSVPLLESSRQLDVPSILNACRPSTKLIFIPSPNAPMGHLMTRDAIISLCQGRERQSLIVIDEAYVEFTDEPQGLTGELADCPNLVLLRTLSKAHALAGERIGCVIGGTELIDHLRKVIAPYPLTQSSIKAALEALSPNGLIQSQGKREVLKSERARMARLLPQSPYITSIFPSEANYLLAETRDAKAVMQHLRRFGILARDRSTEVPNSVRFSIGTPDQNDAVLAALEIKLDPKEKIHEARLFSARRSTNETAIDVTVNLDAPTFLKIDTGVGFFDHMLAQLASHGGFGLELHCEGDLEIDQHHTIEDCALALGEALKGALGDKRGIGRFGFSAPLDEAVAHVVIDLSGRPYASFTGDFKVPHVGELGTEMVPHFFRSLATSMAAAIHVTVTGDNAHHMTEAAFKATGRALRQAFRREGDNHIPSTKGVL